MAMDCAALQGMHTHTHTHAHMHTHTQRERYHTGFLMAVKCGFMEAHVGVRIIIVIIMLASTQPLMCITIL